MLLGDGYPKTVGDNELDALVIVDPETNNDLCAAGQVSRRKRETGEYRVKK